MAVTVDTLAGIRYIRLKGALDIAKAAELKRMLTDAIASSPEVRVEVAGASAIDGTIVQLLLAAVSHANSIGSEVILQGPVSEAVKDSLARTGVLPLIAPLLVVSAKEAGSVLASRS